MGLSTDVLISSEAYFYSIRGEALRTSALSSLTHPREVRTSPETPLKLETLTLASSLGILQRHMLVRPRDLVIVWQIRHIRGAPMTKHVFEYYKEVDPAPLFSERSPNAYTTKVVVTQETLESARDLKDSDSLYTHAVAMLRGLESSRYRRRDAVIEHKRQTDAIKLKYQTLVEYNRRIEVGFINIHRKCNICGELVIDSKGKYRNQKHLRSCVVRDVHCEE